MTDAITPAERQAIRPPERIHIADWVERHRVLTEGHAAEPGPKSLARTPFLRPLYAAWSDPYIREVVVCKSAQIGMTDLAIDLVGFTAANDPCPMALFLADQLTAEKVMTDRVQPMLRTTACLAPVVDESRLTKAEAYLRNGFNLAVSWASSIAQTASRPLKHLVLDEVNKPGYSATGDEGSALGRLRQRQETFADSKLLMLSTPTTDAGNITRELETCDAVYDWHVPCPHCGAFQPLRWRAEAYRSMDGAQHQSGLVVWDGGSSATRQQIEETARYQCGECGAPWTTPEKNAAVALGQPVARGPVPTRPVKVGFHFNRLLSLFPGGRLEVMVSSWLEAQRDHGDLQNFINSALGEAWVPKVRESSETEILASRSDLARGVVPEQAVCLTCGIDTQQVGFWFRVRAWALDRTSWGIDEGFLPDWQAVDDLLFSTRFGGRGIWRALIDTGGTREDGAEISRTEDVYWWLRKNWQRLPGRIFGSKGSSRAMDRACKLGEPIDKTPTQKPLRGSIQIVTVNTDFLKESLWSALERSRSHEAGGAWLHADTDATYVRHLLAEEKRRDKSGAYSWVRVRKDNHLLDCEVLNFAAVDPSLLGGIRVFEGRRPSAPKPPPDHPPTPKPAPRQRADDDDWWTRGTMGGNR